MENSRSPNRSQAGRGSFRPEAATSEENSRYSGDAANKQNLGNQQMGRTIMPACSLTRAVCAAGFVISLGISLSLTHAFAQQTVQPASLTPTPAPVPAILQNYSAVTAERLKKP